MNRRKQPILRFALWFVAPLDERLRGLSLVRLMAATCFVFVAHEVFAHEKSLTWVDYAVLVLGVACAFGKKMVYALIQRSQVSIGPKDAPIDAGP